MSRDQIIIEYDENIQPTEEDIVEYAKYIGIDPDQVKKYLRLSFYL